MTPQEFELIIQDNTSGDDGDILIAHPDLPTNQFLITDEELFDILYLYPSVRFLVAATR